MKCNGLAENQVSISSTISVCIQARGRLMAVVQPLLMLSAIVAGLFFQGINLYAFLATQIILVGVLFLVLIHLYDETIHVRINFLSASILMFWFWLAVTVFWSRVPYVSHITFWWIGVLPLAYVVYILSPDMDASWPTLFPLIFVVGVILSLVGLYQFAFLKDSPRGPFIYRNLLAAFLNMLVLVMSACFLIRKDGGGFSKYGRALMSAGIFLLILTVGIISSRGAILCLFVGMTTLIILSRTYVGSGRDILKIMAIFVIALTLAHIYTSGDMGSRMETLSDPYNAGENRFLIWTASWKMLLDGPWYGRGLGTYWFAWPPYRPAGEASGGYFVHNDYLQIAIEGGWPGLILLLAILAAVLYTFIRLYRDASIDDRVKIEATGLFAALIAVFLHNTTDFNLYSMPAMILAGLFMGRLHSLGFDKKAAYIDVPLGRWFNPSVYKSCLILLVLFPMVYFITVGISYFYYQKGNALIKAAQFKKADDALYISEILWPNLDMPKYLRGSIYQVTIHVNPDLNMVLRRQFFLESEKKLKQAHVLNPWRPETFIAHALLYQQNGDLAGGDFYGKASLFYRHALALDPRCYKARVSYAEMLSAKGNHSQAAMILKEGIKHWYPTDYRILPYYRLTSSVCRQVGDEATAQKVDKMITDIVAINKKTPTAPLERSF